MVLGTDVDGVGQLVGSEEHGEGGPNNECRVLELHANVKESRETVVYNPCTIARPSTTHDRPCGEE